jgi:hypothetical protein
MLQRLAVPVRPGKTDGAPRPGRKAWLEMCWSLVEVVVSYFDKIPPQQDRIVLRSSLCAEKVAVFSQEQVAHQAQEGVGRMWPCF